ncbi:MAG: hypothetical protein HXY40_12455 [Chloroflexi bacterium]|nr:hypothetical protein [Chloroflexota bacterium]
MPIAILWDDTHQTTLRYDISGQWNWPEMDQAMETIYTHMDASEHARIDAIIHFRGGVNVPPDAIMRIRQLQARSHPKAGLTVMVGLNPFVKALVGTLRSAYSATTGRTVDFEYADTLVRARQLIASDRQRRM